MTESIARASTGAPLLSICISTFNRADWIGETLAGLMAQVTPQVEVVIVDGASTDGTQAVVQSCMQTWPSIVYHREAENSGVDRDFDKAVQYASGVYCWLMSDDDLLAPDSISQVIARLAAGPELVVVNSRICSKQMQLVLDPDRLRMLADRDFATQDAEQFFTQAAAYLSFIGGVVIRRSQWLARQREPYFGTLFIHVGVIFQLPPLQKVSVIAQPLISIRYGNALWTARGFEIWIAKWPDLVWSFPQFSDIAKATVTPRHPATSLKTLLYFRAIGAYGFAEFGAVLRGKRPHHFMASWVAMIPASFANGLAATYCLLRRQPNSQMMVYELARAKCASTVAKWAARRFRFPETEI